MFGQAVKRRFLRQLFLNYMIAVVIAVVGVGSAFMFLADHVPWTSRAVLSAIGILGILIMLMFEVPTFLWQVRPILNVFQTDAPTSEQLDRAAERTRKLPLYSVFRIMGPHWLGLAIPGLIMIQLAANMRLLSQVTGFDLLLELVASFCVASMHALLEFYLTMFTCQPVLLYFSEYRKKAFGVNLAADKHIRVVVGVRTVFTVSAILIGTLPLLLFTFVTQYHLVNGLHVDVRNYLQWAGAFLVVGMAFSTLSAYLIAKSVQVPIEKLQAGVRAVTEGQFDTVVDNVYMDEFSQLVNGFNTMAQFLQERDAVNRQLLESFLTTLSAALDARDPYTAGHSLRVAQYAVGIATRAGFSADDITIVRNAAILHDIGKIGVRDTVLLKDGRLSDEEFEQIKQHPVIGEQILLQISPLEPIKPLLPGVRSHHERYDGRGYPDGLVGTDIPVIGRLLAVADAFDAMTSDRPYRRGMSKEQATSILESGAGTQWDPAYVAWMVQWMREVDGLADLHPNETNQLRALLSKQQALVEQFE